MLDFEHSVSYFTVDRVENIEGICQNVYDVSLPAIAFFLSISKLMRMTCNRWISLLQSASLGLITAALRESCSINDSSCWRRSNDRAMDKSTPYCVLVYDRLIPSAARGISCGSLHRRSVVLSPSTETRSLPYQRADGGCQWKVRHHSHPFPRVFDIDLLM